MCTGLRKGMLGFLLLLLLPLGGKDGRARVGVASSGSGRGASLSLFVPRCLRGLCGEISAGWDLRGGKLHRLHPLHLFLSPHFDGGPSDVGPRKERYLRGSVSI